MTELDVAATEIRPLVLGGRTGVGKTLLLRGFENALDLEAMAWHRGSAFGRHATPQPTQIDFENRLAAELLRHRSIANPPLIIEDESRNIGSRNIPSRLFNTFKAAPLVVLDASLTERIENTLREYVIDALAEYRTQHGRAAGFERWADYLLDSLDRIRKRLGGVRHAALRRDLATALGLHRDTGDVAAHRKWITTLLTEYYDPMYDYQISRNRHRIVFEGPADDIAAYFHEQTGAVRSDIVSR